MERAGRLLALVSLVAAVYAAGIVMGLLSPSKSILSNKTLRSVNALPAFWRFISIFANNVSVAALVFALSAAALPGLYLVFGNGYALGSVAALAHSRGVSASLLLAAILPHGVIEIPAILYASLLGLLLLSDAISRRPKPEEYLKGMALVVLLLFVAAFVEAYVTPIVAGLAVSG